MNRLKIDTTKSLYKPIEIEVNGKVFEAKTLTRVILRDLSKLEARIRQGEAEAAYEQLELMFGKQKEFDQLTLQHVNEIVTYVTTQLYAPERILPTDKPNEKTEKNGKRPGGTASPQ